MFEADEASTKLSMILKLLPLLPVSGFIFAFLFEGSFYYFWGVDPLQIVEFSDLVRAGVFYIVPAIPFFY
ncbi:hypothetical protein QTO30_01760 [Yoonia sp. GPGPB17]|uniref:hypothetical protein n=1 Tax=Yoonia sp. GPGPB17 TaxID=3026147 RepID=UPI0030C40716